MFERGEGKHKESDYDKEVMTKTNKQKMKKKLNQQKNERKK